MDELEQWMERWRQVWTEGRCDREHIASLFSDDGIYRPEVLVGIEKPYVGVDEIQAYLAKWCAVLGDGEGVFEFGERFRTGPVAAYEWWGVGVLDGQQVSEAGCVVLMFDADGRCTDFRDYHQVLNAVEMPFSGFGRLHT